MLGAQHRVRFHIRRWIWVTLLVPFGSPFALELARGCDVTDTECLAPVIAFLDADARASTQFMLRAYKALRRHSSIEEKASLHSEQENWRANTRRDCRNDDDPVSKASCFGGPALLRGIELDERLAEVIGTEKKRYGLPRLPMTFRQSALGLTVDGTYYENVDILEIERTQNNLFHFNFSVSGGNQHSCSAEGNARLRGYTFTRIPDVDQSMPAESKDLNRKCLFEINVLPHHVRTDGNYECKQYFACGERAGFRHVFIRTDR